MRCDECKFWCNVGITDEGSEDELGECRRKSPVGFDIVDRLEDEVARVHIWSLTACDDWCGEFQAKSNFVVVSLDTPLCTLNFHNRIKLGLFREGVFTLGNLIQMTGDDLLEWKNFGQVSLDEIRDKLSKLGMKLKGE